jgi:hypothetical protein
MSEKFFRSGIDWLRWTVPVSIGRESALPPALAETRGDLIEKPLSWYDSAQSFGFGRLDWHSKRETQGVMVTMTGKDLQAYREAGHDVRELLAYLVRVGASITRIDFAIDVHSSGFGPDDFAALVDSETLRPKSRKRLRWHSQDGKRNTGVTVQFGSRQSERCMRVYDKAAEQKATGDVIRYELELHGRRARAVARAMVQYGVQTTGKKAMRDFVAGEQGLWNEITDTGRVEPQIERVGRRETNSREWLFKVALPAVCEHLQNGDEEVVEYVNRHGFGLVT